VAGERDGKGEGRDGAGFDSVVDFGVVVGIRFFENGTLKHPWF
jgi:hypothetical protein